jgi:hypothetical protein
MPNDRFQTFWNAVFTKVHDRVSKRNEESGPDLKFERIPNGFRVCRESPFLAVERWLDGNQIYGRSEAKDKSGREMPTMYVPLTINGENEASLPSDQLRKAAALTTDDVADAVLGFFPAVWRAARPTPSRFPDHL